MTVFNLFVWFTPEPCGTHFCLPHYLSYTLECLQMTSNLNPPVIHFPQFHPKIFTPISQRGPPDHVGLHPFVWFTPKPCGTHFRLPHNLSYTLEFLNFEPSGHPFSPISPQNIYTHFIEGSPFTMSDFTPFV